VYAVESLLLSRDAEVVRVLEPALEKLSIEVEVCRGVNSGHEILCTEKFDAIIVDCDDLDGGLRVLQGLRKSLSNKNSVTFAILNGSTTTQQAFQMGANFVLQKPSSTLNATRCFSAALNFMIREQRHYFRQPVEIPATLEFDEGRKLKATITNISEGGMAIFFGGISPRAECRRILSYPGPPPPWNRKFRLPGWTILDEPVFASSKCPRVLRTNSFTG
jgi:DNA-binding response OmpR family regulator